MAYTVLRIDSYNSPSGASYVVELNGNPKESVFEMLQILQNWYMDLPESEALKQELGNDILVYSVGIFETQEQAELIHKKQLSRISRMERMRDRIKFQMEKTASKKTKLKNHPRMSFVAHFTDGTAQGFPTRKAFLDFMGVPASCWYLVTPDHIKYEIPLQSRKYPQLNGIILKDLKETGIISE